MDMKVNKSETIDLKEKLNQEKPSREQAMDAVKTLISWAGDNPLREGLLDTPQRVVKAYEEFFSGYEQDPLAVLGKTFEDVEGYDDIVFLRDINIETHCEHHMVPIIGVKRLQTQETMTMQVLQTIDKALNPYGTAVMIDAKHQCMTTRGISKPNVSTVTTKFSGSFSKDTELRERFIRLTQSQG